MAVQVTTAGGGGILWRPLLATACYIGGAC